MMVLSVGSVIIDNLPSSSSINRMIQFLCVITLIAIHFISITITTDSAQCSKDYQHYLSTKTPYRIVANLNQTELKFDQCTATKFWSLIRHGTRTPNSRVIEKMQKRLPEIRDLILNNLHESNDFIRNSDLDAFKRWSTKLTADDEKLLTHEGEDEMLFLAERYQKRLPTIFDKIYSNSTFKFKYTATQRTKKSAEIFAAGLFGRQTVRDIDFPQPLQKDPILRFYKLCNKWQREINKNSSVLIERQRFENSEIMRNTIRRINKRLNLVNQQQQLDMNDIYTLYIVCSFETAWNNNRRFRNNGNGNRSPWCAPFTIDDLKIMEFYEDLKYYWVHGYGYELTYKQACPAFNDLIQFFQNPDPLPKVTTYFTHSGTLLKMIAHMELYRDQKHLRSSQFSLNNNERQWRTSYIGTFGTNLAFVLYNCQNELKVLTLHQERIVRLPPCPDTDLCALQKILDYYNNSIDGCTFDKMCDNF